MLNDKPAWATKLVNDLSIIRADNSNNKLLQILSYNFSGQLEINTESFGQNVQLYKLK
jgi:hypothetical protein